MNKIVFSFTIILLLYIFYKFYKFIVNKYELKFNNNKKLIKVFNDTNIDLSDKIKKINQLDKKIIKKTPYENYIIGSYYLLYKNDKLNALKYFNKSINSIENFRKKNISNGNISNISNGNISNISNISNNSNNKHKENLFILESINDLENIYMFENDKKIFTRTNEFLLRYYYYLNNVFRQNNLIKNEIRHNDIKQNDIKQNEIRQNEIRQNEIRHNDIINNEIKYNEIKQNEIKENLNDKKIWISDSQNVHDSILSDAFITQYNLVSKENTTNQLYNLVSKENTSNQLYDEIIKSLHNKCKNDEEKNKLNKIFKILDNNYKFDENIYEKDVLINIWLRSLHTNNKDNKDNIQNAIFDNMLDCIENKNVVCIRGRTPKLWQSLALLDYDKNIGILKSKQLIKNEIYEKCGKTINNIINKQPKNIIDDYNNSKNNIEVNNLIKLLHQNIDNIKNEYKNKLEEIQLDTIIEECKSLV
jgi:hypothetical protein